MPLLFTTTTAIGEVRQRSVQQLAIGAVFVPVAMLRADATAAQYAATPPYLVGGNTPLACRRTLRVP